MGRDVCITCGQSVRDFDEQPVGDRTALPAHGCDRPVGSFPWNDGQHLVVDGDPRWGPAPLEFSGPTDCRGEPLDLGPEPYLGPATSADLLELGPWCSAAEHGAACVPPCPAAPSDLGPATRAVLEDLDAVPEPVDSDAPRTVHGAGAEMQPDARPRRRTQTGPDGVPREPDEDDEPGERTQPIRGYMGLRAHEEP